MIEKNKKIHFIDCGANVGQSILWAIETYGGRITKIDSFEPYKANFEVLEGKFRGSPKVRLYQKAVWVESTKIKFYVQDWGARTGSSIIEGKSSTGKKYEVVEAIDLSEWIKENVSKENYNILKIDIEGAEYDVLPHLLKNGVQDYIDIWCVEYHGHKIPKCDRSIEKTLFEIVGKENFIDWGKHVVYNVR